MRHLFLICGMWMICIPAASAEPDAKTLVKQVIAAAGGEDKLLKRFRMQERYNSGAKRQSAGTPRTSVVEPPKYWWVGTKERGKEPAKMTTWAWTLGPLTDAQSQIARLPDVTENENPLEGLRITDTIQPPLDMYFDKKTHRLVRMDWNQDIYVFSEYREYDGTAYPTKCVMYKRKTRTPWFHHEIIKLERLTERPANLR